MSTISLYLIWLNLHLIKLRAFHLSIFFRCCLKMKEDTNRIKREWHRVAVKVLHSFIWCFSCVRVCVCERVYAMYCFHKSFRWPFFFIRNYITMTFWTNRARRTHGWDMWINSVLLWCRLTRCNRFNVISFRFHFFSLFPQIFSCDSPLTRFAFTLFSLYCRNTCNHQYCSHRS